MTSYMQKVLLLGIVFGECPITSVRHKSSTIATTVVYPAWVHATFGSSVSVLSCVHVACSLRGLCSSILWMPFLNFLVWSIC